ncbi:unnamed protein product [Toxocara canis]|uniref:tRNA_int_endo domain-containing protein n=1 Tax=Toxocara canis TaxID=6265 RepID=A0A183VAX9_TOXCA|nr:unnamed protein product [Toxocara canis]
MDLMYFERKRGVPENYRRPIIVPLGRFNGVLIGGEVLVSEPDQANDLNDMGCFGNFLERRVPVVAPECFGIKSRLLKTSGKANDGPGIAYGVDLILYCDGPDYLHSSAAVRLVDDEQMDARLFAILNRGLNNMKKALLEVRVDIPMGLSLVEGVKCMDGVSVKCVAVAMCRLNDLKKE